MQPKVQYVHIHSLQQNLRIKFRSSRISAFHVLRPRNRNDDVVLALTTTGTVKVWTLNGDEHAHSSEPILENESKQVKRKILFQHSANYWQALNLEIHHSSILTFIVPPFRKKTRIDFDHFLLRNSLTSWIDE